MGDLPAGPRGVVRDAHFICVLALAWPDGHVEWFEGNFEVLPRIIST